MQGMPKVIGVFRVNHGGVASPECTVSLLHVVVMLLFICMGTHQGSKAPTWAAAGVAIAALVVLLIVSAVQCAVIFGSAPDSKQCQLQRMCSVFTTRLKRMERWWTRGVHSDCISNS